MDKITDRKRQVLTLLLWGLTAKQVARRLHIDSRTVETHRDNAVKRLGVRDRHELMIIAAADGVFNEVPT